MRGRNIQCRAAGDGDAADHSGANKQSFKETDELAQKEIVLFFICLVLRQRGVRSLH